MFQVGIQRIPPRFIIERHVVQVVQRGLGVVDSGDGDDGGQGRDDKGRKVEVAEDPFLFALAEQRVGEDDVVVVLVLMGEEGAEASEESRPGFDEVGSVVAVVPPTVHATVGKIAHEEGNGASEPCGVVAILGAKVVVVAVELLLGHVGRRAQDSLDGLKSHALAVVVQLVEDGIEMLGPHVVVLGVGILGVPKRLHAVETEEIRKEGDLVTG